MSFPTTHWTVVSAAAAGDHAAFEALVQAYRKPLLAYFARTEVSDAAEDLLQEVYLALFQGALASAERVRGRFRSLLLAVARNTAISELPPPDRAEAGGGSRHLGLDSAEPVAVGGDAEAEEAFNAEWVSGLTLDALETLGRTHPHYHSAIRMTLLEGSSYAEAASKSGVGVHQIKNWAHRGKHKLRGLLRREITKYAVSAEDFELEVRWVESMLLRTSE